MDQLRRMAGFVLVGLAGLLGAAGCSTTGHESGTIDRGKSFESTITLLENTFFPSGQGVVDSLATVARTTVEDAERTAENVVGIGECVRNEFKDGGRQLGYLWDRYKSQVHDDTRTFGHDLRSFWFLIY